MTEIDTPASAAPPVAAVTRPRTIAAVAICESAMVLASSVWPAKTVYETEAPLYPVRVSWAEYVPAVRLLTVKRPSPPVVAFPEEVPLTETLTPASGRFVLWSMTLPVKTAAAGEAEPVIRARRATAVRKGGCFPLPPGPCLARRELHPSSASVFA